jgi:hypothetical protein
VRDANGICLAHVYARDDLHRLRFGQYHEHLTSDEARRIANGIARLPEFMMQRRGFNERGTGQYRWKRSRPYHVALEDSYIRAHWGFIDAVCKMNSIPFDGTGEHIERDGSWRVYEFSVRLDAIQFWDRFDGRWLRGEEFIYPDRPNGLPSRLICLGLGEGRQGGDQRSRESLSLSLKILSASSPSVRVRSSPSMRTHSPSSLSD